MPVESVAPMSVPPDIVRVLYMIIVEVTVSEPPESVRRSSAIREAMDWLLVESVTRKSPKGRLMETSSEGPGKVVAVDQLEATVQLPSESTAQETTAARSGMLNVDWRAAEAVAAQRIPRMAGLNFMTYLIPAK
jgi:hypothetical protein